MKTKVLICLLTVAVTCSAQDKVQLPREVVKFVERREACEHFRGEIPNVDQKKRLEEVIRKTNTFCRGTDKKLAYLRKKYARDTGVIDRLKDYEAEIN